MGLDAIGLDRVVLDWMPLLCIGIGLVWFGFDLVVSPSLDWARLNYTRLDKSRPDPIDDWTGIYP
eukprot:3787308-Lingulodinium_polyedra.AAC.1